MKWTGSKWVEEYPRNHGDLWTAEDSSVLIESFADGMPVERIASLLGRSEGSIMARLGMMAGDMVTFVLEDGRQVRILLSAEVSSPAEHGWESHGADPRI